MEKYIKGVVELVLFLKSYPGWVQIIFVITFALFLLSIFLLVIMYPSASNKKKRTYVAFRITEPKEEYVSEEYVKVSGGGAPPGSAIILVTSLDGKWLAPQKGSVTADRNGNWWHPRCHLLHIGRDRLVYALAVDIRHEDKVRKLLQEIGKSPTDKSMDKFGEILEAERITFQLTPKKRLIRKNGFVKNT